MLDFAFDKLQYDEDKRIVSVTPDFDPEIDVTIRDIMRHRNWALVDADGYPLRTKLADSDNPKARYSCIKHYHITEFDGEATGWHGSVSRGLYCSDKYCSGRRLVFANVDWQGGSGVAVVAREDA